MTEYESLRDRLAEKPFLVADGATGEVKLVEGADALEMVTAAGLFNAQVVMNVRKALENFAQLIGKADRNFSLREIATMTGTPYSQAYNWVDEKVIVPSIRPATGSGKGKEPIFSWTDGFVAGACGSLRRQGVRLELLRQVAAVFSEDKKRTGKRMTAASRS